MGDFDVVVGEHDWTVDDGQRRFNVCSKMEHPNFNRYLKLFIKIL